MAYTQGFVDGQMLNHQHVKDVRSDGGVCGKSVSDASCRKVRRYGMSKQIDRVVGIRREQVGD